MAKRSSRIWHIFLVSLTFISFTCVKEAKAAQPLDTGEHMIELNSVKLWYKVSGTGPVCIMPSCAYGPGSDLNFLTLGSMEKVFTVVYLDSRGTGRSGRAKTFKEYTWDHLVADLEALRAHLKQDAIWLMGHSGGGIQPLFYALKYPSRVSGLVLLNTVAFTGEEKVADTQKRVDKWEGNPLYADAIKERAAWRSQVLGAIDRRTLQDEDYQKHLERMGALYWSDPKKAEQFQDAWAAITYSAHASVGVVESKRRPFDLRPQLKKITAPSLIVVGDDDFIASPEMATQLHLGLPNSKLLLIEDAGHMPWLEQPQVFEARVAEFLLALGLRAN